jgi:hypothetical protein
VSFGQTLVRNKETKLMMVIVYRPGLLYLEGMLQ